MGDAFRTASTRLRRKYAVRSGSCQPSAEFVDSYFFLGSRSGRGRYWRPGKRGFLGKSLGTADYLEISPSSKLGAALEITS